jgi:hypothetical protein
MNAEEYSGLISRLREMAGSTNTTSTSEEMLCTAEALAKQLTRKERDGAATLYLVRMLREMHRQTVVEVERAASGRRPRLIEQTPEELARRKERKAEQEAADEVSRNRFRASLQEALDTYTREMRMQWTTELLNSTFALPDGTMVSWGEASVEQHLARREMLAANARGNLEAAARHEVAIRRLRETNADCLNSASLAVA